VNAGASMV